MNSFKSDSIKLAKEVLDRFAQYHDGGDHLDLTGFECVFCKNGHFSETEEMIHLTDCAVLIAIDLTA